MANIAAFIEDCFMCPEEDLQAFVNLTPINIKKIINEQGMRAFTANPVYFNYVYDPDEEQMPDLVDDAGNIIPFERTWLQIAGEVIYYLKLNFLTQ